jgi:hypothetical protein
MVRLAQCVVSIIVDEYGVHELLRRLSDPWFFQSLSCVLGYDWHSSGTTTVTCAALKEAIDPSELGVAVTGGKGKTSRRTPDEIEALAEALGLGSQRVEGLRYASRMAAKVDNALIQDGYSLYHHTFLFDEHGHWIVIQQGMNDEMGNARRYHWPMERGNLIVEPHTAILCNTKLTSVLDMTSKVSEGNRKACVDIIREGPRRLRRLIAEAPKHQTTLERWMGVKAPKHLVMPRSINWKALTKAYDFQPKDYEEFISLKGVGPSTIRGLALVAELVYGEEASWRDPVRYSFAFGGKDGVPYPVNKRVMDEAINILKSGIREARLGREEKLRAIERLRRCVPPAIRGTFRP